MPPKQPQIHMNRHWLLTDGSTRIFWPVFPTSDLAPVVPVVASQRLKDHRRRIAHKAVNAGGGIEFHRERLVGVSQFARCRPNGIVTDRCSRFTPSSELDIDFVRTVRSNIGRRIAE